MSMLPVLSEGDLVVVVPIAWDDIAVGDIVTYRWDDKFPARRVVRKFDEEALLWCDNWPGVTARVHCADILGRVEWWLRGGTWIQASAPSCIAARRRAMRGYRCWRLRRAAPRWLLAVGRVVRRRLVHAA